MLTFGYLSTGNSKRITRFTTNDLGLPHANCQSMFIPCGPLNFCCTKLFYYRWHKVLNLKLRPRRANQQSKFRSIKQKVRYCTFLTNKYSTQLIAESNALLNGLAVFSSRSGPRFQALLLCNRKMQSEKYIIEDKS